MKYWAEHQVKHQDFFEGQALTSIIEGAPAWMGFYRDQHGNVLGDYEIEIVPNSLREDFYIDAYTGFNEVADVVDVVVRKRYNGEILFEELFEVWPIEWFNLTEIPETDVWDPISAYERAMRIFK